MKLVIAIIQPTKLKAVREALEKIEVTRMTVCDAQGYGRQRGAQRCTAGTNTRPPFCARSPWRSWSTTIFCNGPSIRFRALRTGPEGNIGDGKIFVVPALEAIQIRSASRGPGAV